MALAADCDLLKLFFHMFEREEDLRVCPLTLLVRQHCPVHSSHNGCQATTLGRQRSPNALCSHERQACEVNPIRDGNGHVMSRGPCALSPFRLAPLMPLIQLSRSSTAFPPAVTRKGSQPLPIGQPRNGWPTCRLHKVKHTTPQLSLR